jgi:hypothetical protein
MPSDSSGRPQFHDTIRAGERQACLSRLAASLLVFLFPPASASDEQSTNGSPALPVRQKASSTSLTLARDNQITCNGWVVHVPGYISIIPNFGGQPERPVSFGKTQQIGQRLFLCFPL